jgi:hypothetical protein
VSVPCRSCGAAVIWTVTAATGSRMPVDAEPVEDGNVVLAASPVVGDPPTSYTAPAGELLLGGSTQRLERYVSHFVTCPHADAHRRTRHAR